MAASRRVFLHAIAGALLALPFAVCAQRSKPTYLIGFLSNKFDRNFRPAEVFFDELRRLGYVEGENFTILVKDVEGRQERYPELAVELVAQKPDFIMAAATPAARAAMRATKTIPILFIGDPDPVASGLVATLARPGGNVTGLSNIGTEIFGKRLEILKQAFPGVRQVAYLWQRGVFPERTETDMLKRAETEARSLGLQLQFAEVRGPADLDRAFSAMVLKRPDALILHNPGPALFGERRRIAQLAIVHRLPTMGAVRDFVDDGGLMSYGADWTVTWRRAAAYVDKILKGAKPGDLPVEQAAKFELVINLRTAKSLGVTIPPALLARVDDVLQ